MAGTGEKLGIALSQCRSVKGFSLRGTAERASITPTYLQKLERGQVKEPSPNVLYRLADALEVPYGDLMVLAGYVIPGKTTVDSSTPKNVLASALKSSDISADEAAEMAHYLGYLRAQRRRKG